MSEAKPSKNNGVDRRGFLGKITFGAFGLGMLGQFWTYLRSFVPNVLYEPPKRFKVGQPGDMAQGMNFIEDQKVFIFRKGSQYYSISGICTHLGCTVKYVPFDRVQTVSIGGTETTVDHEFRCPCHGSAFHQDGSPYSGPAPRKLSFHKLDLAPEDGQLIVDLSSTVDGDTRLTV